MARAAAHARDRRQHDRGGAAELAGRRERRVLPPPTSSRPSRPTRPSSTSRPRPTASAADCWCRAGAEVEVGAPIAVLGAPGEQVDDLDAASPTSAWARTGALGAGARATTVVDIPEAAFERGPRSPAPVATAHGPGLRQPAWPAGWPGRPGCRLDRAHRHRAATAGSCGETLSGAQAAPARSAERACSGRRPGHAGGLHRRSRTRRLRTASPRGSPRASQTAPHFYLRGDVPGRPSARAARGAQRRRATCGSRSTTCVVKAVAQAHLLVPEMNVDLDRGRRPVVRRRSTSRSRWPPTTAW